MELEQLKKANELRERIMDLNSKINSLVEIKEQAGSFCTSAGLNLEFVNVRAIKRSFGVSTVEMRFIINYILDSWEKQLRELENEFEKL